MLGKISTLLFYLQVPRSQDITNIQFNLPTENMPKRNHSRALSICTDFCKHHCSNRNKVSFVIPLFGLSTHWIQEDPDNQSLHCSLPFCGLDLTRFTFRYLCVCTCVQVWA